jgi:hypothetical protein
VKTIERKMTAVQERVQRLNQLAGGLNSFEDYNCSVDACQRRRENALKAPV